MRTNRAYSLIEILTVVAIIICVSAVLWLAAGPKVKLGAVGSVVRSELRQLHNALNLYMIDYDGAYPTGMRALKAHIPATQRKTKAVVTPIPGCSKYLEYHFTRNIDILRGETTYAARFPFDITRNPIFKQSFFCMIPGTQEDFQCTLTNGQVQVVKREVKHVLGIRMDGKVDWFDMSEQWEDEYANRARIRKLSK